MTLPRYILDRYWKPGGVRLRKLEPPIKVAGICPLCLKEVVFGRINGEEQLTGIRWGGGVWHYHCHQANRPGPGRQFADFRVLNGRGKPVKGNLDEAEYRYWIGFPDDCTILAICRACRTQVYGKFERDRHFKDPTYAVDGDPCSTQLVRCYKRLLTLTHCIVCKKNRYNSERWGVPLCNSADCEATWKFGTDKWAPLQACLNSLKKKAAAKAMEIPVLNMPRAWCRVCETYTDTKGHNEIHMAYLKLGRGANGKEIYPLVE